jgi:hypothetical protein
VRRLTVAFALVAALATPGYAQGKPVHHYVFFGGEREQIRTDSSFLKGKNVEARRSSIRGDCSSHAGTSTISVQFAMTSDF